MRCIRMIFSFSEVLGGSLVLNNSVPRDKQSFPEPDVLRGRSNEMCAR